jgi:hypothetical protein
LDVIEGEIPTETAHCVAVETLPLSGKVWTVEGYPAAWRTKPDRKPQPR